MPRWDPDAQGRLVKAALALFDEHGYDATTVAQIAEAAGLTKRTFFRYFADKREVLFDGSRALEALWASGIEAAPADAGPMAAVSAGLDQVARLFADRQPFARIRARVIAANPELRERELIKLQTLAGAVERALAERGVPPDTASLAAQAGITVFHAAFTRWLDQDDPAALGRLAHESLDQLRSVTAG